ncbi:Guanine deaminase [Planctomycetes bacterium Pan216]|uniref:Guanine deaminase n=1 Tax=Kolteria novifilia TaxID=2527975 RepID=A0A518B4D5_9BACT|nr:Guanine deaminase [Planctomycetes bacterium Pan216]
MDHEFFMRRAIEMGKKNPKFAFGAVVVERGTQHILAEGVNNASANPTHHGEIVAINDCATNHPKIDWSGLALYTTAEPCPMCQSAILWAGIGNVYYGTSIPTLQRFGWNQIDIRAEEVGRRAGFAKVSLTGGILEADCDDLFRRPPG